MATRRKYKGTAAQMLTACATMVENAIEHKDFLTTKRANWADPYFPDLKLKIEDAFTEHLGMDSGKATREATRVVLELQKAAIEDLGDLKVQIEVDFEAARRKEILTQLGLREHYKSVTNKNQQALVELLLTFQKNMTNDLKAELMAKGVAEVLITDTISRANALRDANISQETLKLARTKLTEGAVEALNEIYTEVMGIARIAKRFFKGDKSSQLQFTYSHILNNMTSISTSKSQTPTA